MNDISFLPGDARQQEEKTKTPAESSTEKLTMHVPHAEQDDVEVIEIDEGEVDQVLQHEPGLSRLLFFLQSHFEDLKARLFQSPPQEPPPKNPPQFFKPPSVTSASPISKPANIRIVPEAKAPRRVRVIRRVRKPVQVSFLQQAAVAAHIDIPRRRFTLIVMGVALCLSLTGAYVFLDRQERRVQGNAMQVQAQLQAIRVRASEYEQRWDSYRDLEPRLRALRTLLDQHVSPGKVFDALDALTVPTVWYSSFTLSPDGRLVLAVSAPSFEDAARQIVAFQESGIASRVQAVGYQTTYGNNGHLERVGFQISLTLEPGVLRALEPLALP